MSTKNICIYGEAEVLLKNICLYGETEVLLIGTNNTYVFLWRSLGASNEY